MKSVFLVLTLVCAIFASVSAVEDEVQEEIREEIDEIVELGEDRCLLPARAGTASCRADIDSWYHDFEEGKCKEFVYGGCGGNFNRFPTKKMCERACAHLYRGIAAFRPASLDNTKYNLITAIIDYTS